MKDISYSKAFRAVRAKFMKVGFLYKPYHRLRRWWGEEIGRRHKAQRTRNLMEYGRSMLSDVCTAVEGMDTEIFCDYGTLLGLIRGGDLIAYDDDLDMGIIPSDTFSWDELERILAGIGLEKTRQFSLDGRITEQTYRRDGVPIDFFMHEIDGEEMVVYEYFKDPEAVYDNNADYSVNEYRTCIVHDVSPREIGGMHVLIPENAEQFLADAYGENWRTPDPDQSYNKDIGNGVAGKIGHFDLC